MPDKLTKSELEILVIRIQNKSSKDLQRDLHNNLFSDKERPYIEEYIPQKIKEERNQQIKLYHRRKAPDGKLFKAYEVSALENKDWVDSPSKIENDIRDKIVDIMKTVFAFWCKEYKWILGFILTAIALYLTYLQITTLDK